MTNPAGRPAEPLAAREPPPPVTVPLRTSGQARLMRGMAGQHLAAGVALVSAGLAALDEEPHGHAAFAWLAIAAGIFLIGAVVRELRSKHHPATARLGWVDLVAIPGVLLEGIHMQLRGKRYLPWAYYALALLTLARGLFFSRLMGLARVKMDSSALKVRTRGFRSRRCLWRDVTRIEKERAGLSLILTAGGSLPIDLHEVINRDEAEAAILAYFDRVTAFSSHPGAALPR